MVKKHVLTPPNNQPNFNVFKIKDADDIIGLIYKILKHLSGLMSSLLN
jgi:hypothetical protein